MVPASRWSAVVSDQRSEQNQVGLELLLGIAIAYSAIGIASTSLMSTSGRRGELALLRLTGATRRQIAWIVAAESLALTFVAVAASAAISGLVLGGLWVAFARAAGFTPIVRAVAADRDHHRRGRAHRRRRLDPAGARFQRPG